MKSKLYINILTNSTLSSKEDGRNLLNIWKDELPSIVPEKFGNYEPLKKDFNPDSLDDALSFWDYPFILRRKRPRMSGSIFMGGGKIPTHGWIHIVSDFSPTYDTEVVNFLKRVAVTFDVEFAFIHLLTTNEFSGDSYTTGVFSVKSDKNMNVLSVTTHELKKNIPDLYWATVLGTSYSRLFGESKLRSVEGLYRLEELNPGQFYIQMSQRLSDLETDFELLSKRRGLVKEYLNSNAFFDPSNPPSHRYSSPVFDKIK
jgi:hypothetical protein